MSYGIGDWNRHHKSQRSCVDAQVGAQFLVTGIKQAEARLSGGDWQAWRMICSLERVDDGTPVRTALLCMCRVLGVRAHPMCSAL